LIAVRYVAKPSHLCWPLTNFQVLLADYIFEAIDGPVYPPNFAVAGEAGFEICYHC
jgi:hypothetical protein